MQTKKYKVSIQEALIEQIKDIPCFFTNHAGVSKDESMNNRVLNAFLLALSKDATGKDSYYQTLSFEERKPSNRSIVTFRLPSWLFEMVKKKYEIKAKVFNNIVFMYVLADALIHQPNLNYVPPAFSFVGQKNEKMRYKTKMILGKKLGKDNLLYVEPFCGSAALFLSLPLQPTWKYILNDWSKNKVNLLRAIKYKPLELIEEILKYNYKPENYEGTDNAIRQELTAYVEWFEDYIFAYWLGEQSAKIRSEKNKRKHKYDRIPRNNVIPTDNQRYPKNQHIDHAAAYFVYISMIGRNKLSEKRFMELLGYIPLISLKLNRAKAKILYGDGIKIVKEYADTSNIAGYKKNTAYKNHKTLIVADPPYISSEEQCDKNDFALRHSEMVNLIHRIKRHCFILYFCRSSSPLRFKGKEREIRDIVLKGEIDDFFKEKGYHYEEYRLSDNPKQPIKEFMVTNFKHHKSKPYR
jgi:site-specific DNA-adenine methylase